MTSELDRRLRTALHQVPRESPPPDLAGAALAGAARHRRRRAVGLTAAVAAVTAVAIVVPAVQVPSGPPEGTPGASAPSAGPSPVGPTPSAGPSPVGPAPTAAAYTDVDRPRGEWSGHSLLRDPASGRLVRLDVPDLSLSPDGSRVLVRERDDGSTPEPTRYGIADRAALLSGGLAAVRWLGGEVQVMAAPLPRWSPDGGRLLFSAASDSGPALRVGVVDAATGRVVTRFVIADPGCKWCDVSWSADGTRIGLLLGDEPQEAAVQFYDLQGRPTTRWSGVPGVPEDWWSVSPSGRLVVVPDIIGGGDPVVLDARTGRMLRRTAGGGILVGWYDEEHLVRARLGDGGPVPSRPGSAGGASTLPAPVMSGSPSGGVDPAPSGRRRLVRSLEIVTLDGRVVRTVPLSDGPDALGVVLG